LWHPAETKQKWKLGMKKNNFTGCCSKDTDYQPYYILHLFAPWNGTMDTVFRFINSNFPLLTTPPTVYDSHRDVCRKKNTCCYKWSLARCLTVSLPLIFKTRFIDLTWRKRRKRRNLFWLPDIFSLYQVSTKRHCVWFHAKKWT
jgi:hypothetical protein